MPVDQNKYPANWKQISQERKEAAGWQCEEMISFEWLPTYKVRCYRKQGMEVQGVRRQAYKVVLTVAHLDHNPENNDASNLRVLCQEHHLAYDHALHIQHAKETRKRKRAQLQPGLFGGNDGNHS
jgi:hypothetical protein